MADADCRCASLDGDPQRASLSDMDEIEDDVFKQLAAVFLAVGRGRRPNLPNLVCTNKVLLQFYALKNQANESWDTVAEWLSKLFTYRSQRFRPLIEKTVKKWKSLTPSQRIRFYDEVVDLEFVGLECAAHGLTRSRLLEPLNLRLENPTVLTNGFVLELEEFCAKEGQGVSYLVFLLNELVGGDTQFDVQRVRAQVKAVKSKLNALKKSKSRNPAASSNLMAEAFESPKCPTSSTTSGHGASETNDNESGLNPKKIKVLLDKEKQRTLLLETELAAFKEMCHENETRSKKMETAFQEAESRADNLQSQVVKLQSSLSDSTQQLLSANSTKRELKSVKRGSYYKRLARKERAMKAKLSKLHDVSTSDCDCSRSASAKIVQLERQIGGLQKTVSRHKTISKLYLAEKNCAKAALKHCKDTCLALDAELHVLQSDDLATKDGQHYTEEVQKTVMELVGEKEVSSKNCCGVIQAVAHWMFGKNIQTSDLPCPNTAVNLMDKAHVLSKFQVAESIMDASAWNLHSDGTSRDHKKIVGQQIALDTGRILSAGFSAVAIEDSATLLDNAISMMQELSNVYDESESEKVYKQILSKMFATMADRSSVNKLFNQQLSEHKQEVLGSDVDMHFLFCNAHFLLGLSNECEKALKAFESALVAELGHCLGRDEESKFSRFKSSTESAGARYVRTTCDVLGPRGDEKNGCKMDWDAFCKEKLELKSKVTSFRSNRFNNFFQGAASLFYHREHIKEFLGEFKDPTVMNLKLQSVLYDCKSVHVQALAKALGLIYYRVTGPFWDMLKGNVQYVDQYRYVQKMLSCFQEWSKDATPLMSVDNLEMFPDFVIKHDDVLAALLEEFSGDHTTKLALEQIMASFINVVERQLADFLPGGKYGQEVSQDLRAKMKHCKLTNLLSENEFGDLDFGMFKRRNASVHYHSGIQMVKRNKTISTWLASKPLDEQNKLLKLAGAKSKKLRESHLNAERDILVKLKERLEVNHRKKKEKEAAKVIAQNKLLVSVRNHGGPCVDAGDVGRLLASCKTKGARLSVLKDEIRYLTQILGVKDRRLVMTKIDADGLTKDLISVLSSTDTPVPSCSSTYMEGPGKVNSNETDMPVPPLAIAGQSKKRRADEMFDKDSDADGCIEHDDIDCDASIAKKQRVEDFNFQFTTQGQWIAVAYELDYFIGQVLDIKSNQLALVQFMSKGYNATYKWPQVEDIDDIDAKFVFAADFDVHVGSRNIAVPHLHELDSQFKQYRELYFDTDS